VSLNEVIALVADRIGVTEAFVEEHYTVEQLLLRNHFGVMQTKRELDYLSSSMANKTARILAKAFGA
jgi:hypothetical protein